jgi:hypothetical protein
VSTRGGTVSASRAPQSFYATARKSGAHRDYRGPGQTGLLRDCIVGDPSDASKTALHFRASSCGVLPALERVSSTCLCEEFKVSAAARVNMPHFHHALIIL